MAGSFDLRKLRAQHQSPKINAKLHWEAIREHVRTARRN